jgi:hypothetical protein
MKHGAPYKNLTEVEEHFEGHLKQLPRIFPEISRNIIKKYRKSSDSK